MANDLPTSSTRPVAILATALAAAGVGLLELAWTHRAAGPFETGHVWVGVLVTALVHGVLGALLAVVARALGGLGFRRLGQASAAVPLALAIPLGAHLLAHQWSRWSSPSMRVLELALVVAFCLLAVAALATALRAVPVLATARTWLVVTALAALYVGFQPQVARPARKDVAPRSSGPSALLVTIDTLRADGLGAYGHAAARTPTLDGLAEQGVLFETAVSHSVLTGPSHMSILSGLLPMQHGVIENAQRLPAEVPTVAERLSAEGWATAAFVSGFPVSNRASGLLERFDCWDDDMRAERRMPRLLWELALGRLARRLLEPMGLDPLPKWRKAPRVSDAAVDWLESGDEPFFAWVHYFDPHLPYEVPAELMPEEARAFSGPRGEDWYHLDPDQRRRVIEDPAAVARMRQLYDAEIALVDRELARVLAAARARAGRAADGELWIVVTADHGEAFGEHGIWYRRELYDESLRVPLILGTPPDGPRGVRVSEQVRLTDLAPTLLDALDLPVELAGEGISLLPLAGGSRTELPGPSIAAIYTSRADPYQRFLLAVRTGRWKAIWRAEGWLNADAKWSGETRELYDLAADPTEVSNLSAAQAGLWQSLRDKAGEVRLDMRSTDDLTTQDLEVLRSLGYTQ